ncbi:fungal STAND NTPase-like protein [Microdochium nivale]|nr:fungal STAND NTPase-like protein [Microdochium nivale]
MEVAGTALAVASAAATTTLVITKLVLEVRELRDELEATQAELRSIDGVLFSIADVVHSSTHAGSAISASLLQRLADVIKRCEDAVVDTSSLVQRFSGGGFRRTAKWFLAGKNEVATMQGRLARCKEDLILALSMLNISVSSSVHDGTAELLQGNDSIRRDVQQIIAGVRSLQDDQVKMDELLVLLRSLSMQSTRNIMLDRFVSNLSDYAQTVYERSTVVADGDVEAYACLPACTISHPRSVTSATFPGCSALQS